MFGIFLFVAVFIAYLTPVWGALAEVYGDLSVHHNYINLLRVYYIRFSRNPSGRGVTSSLFSLFSPSSLSSLSSIRANGCVSFDSNFLICLCLFPFPSSLCASVFKWSQVPRLLAWSCGGILSLLRIFLASNWAESFLSRSQRWSWIHRFFCSWHSCRQLRSHPCYRTQWNHILVIFLRNLWQSWPI